VPRDPLALRARLHQHLRARPLPEHRGEPLPTRDDAAVRDRAVVRLDRQLTLALVHIQADALHGGWPPGVRPLGKG